MVTPELLSYISSQLKKNSSRENIISNLLAVGWHSDDIREGFEKLAIDVAATPVARPIVSQPIEITSGSVIAKPEPKVVIAVPAEKEEELLPKLMSKAPTSELSSKPVIPESFIPKVQTTVPSISNPAPIDPGILSGAIMSTYPRDVIAVREAKKVEPAPATQNINQGSSGPKKGGKAKWFFLIFILLALASAATLSVLGYINLPYVNSTLIKKDPKVFLTNMSALLAQTNAYKTDTNITVASPLFSDITTSLLTGEVISSKSKDSLSIHIKGDISQEGMLTPSSQYVATVKSSMLKDEIVAKAVHTGQTSFITIPDLSRFLSNNFPKATTVAVKDGELALLLPVIKESIAQRITKYDAYKILTNGVSPVVSGEISKSGQEFANSLTFISKEDDLIDGAPVYHYQAEASSQVTKKLFSDISNLLFTSLPSTDKERLINVFGAIHIDSIDVWIGKGESQMYQYKVIMTIPLSEVLSLEDKSLAGSVLKLEWQTKVYDVGAPNIVTPPRESVPMADYVKNISDMKIKNATESFPLAAQAFRNATLNFGKASNVSGSCATPTPSSLFSPTGHSKGATLAVGDIATLISTMIKLAGGSASCYSTSSSWAVALPLASDPAEYYCIDSTGTQVNLATKLAGPMCK